MVTPGLRESSDRVRSLQRPTTTAILEESRSWASACCAEAASELSATSPTATPSSRPVRRASTCARGATSSRCRSRSTPRCRSPGSASSTARWPGWSMARAGTEEGEAAAYPLGHAARAPEHGRVGRHPQRAPGRGPRPSRARVGVRLSIVVPALPMPAPAARRGGRFRRQVARRCRWAAHS